VVSTANNHALDYGRAAKDSTIQYLRQAGVLCSGTAAVRDSLYEPAILERNGVRFAFFAVTAIMNMPGDWWKGHVAFADTGKLLPRIRAWRESVDVVVVSYHGGNEYQDRPHRPLRKFAEAVLNNGGDLFLGHHPHVPYGIVSVGKGLAAHSLGNFVFNQPQRYWTRRSFGLAVTFTRDGGRTSISDWSVLPLRAGNQPQFLPPGAEADSIMARVRALSSIWKSEMVSWQ
jgi:poly-gamma-glutamate synthesis protein (capsule biosynthesis protein)